MRDKTFDEVLNNVFNELVLLEKELINYKEQIDKLKKQNEIMREALKRAHREFGELYCKAKAPDNYMISDIEDALKKVEVME
jgi:hypothetical protein